MSIKIPTDSIKAINEGEYCTEIILKKGAIIYIDKECIVIIKPEFVLIED